jgi:hypothetical protein
MSVRRGTHGSPRSLLAVAGWYPDNQTHHGERERYCMREFARDLGGKRTISRLPGYQNPTL